MMRFGRRHIEENARVHVSTYLAALGWADSVQDNRPFKLGGQTTVVTGMVGLDGSRPIAVGTNAPIVSIAIPGDNQDADQEVGGPLVETTYDLFVSVIAEPAIVGVLTEDIVNLLAGRSARPIIPFNDIQTSAAVTDEVLELQDVSSGRARPDRDDWMLVTATIVRTFSRDWS